MGMWNDVAVSYMTPKRPDLETKFEWSGVTDLKYRLIQLIIMGICRVAVLQYILIVSASIPLFFCLPTILGGIFMVSSGTLYFVVSTEHYL